MKDPNPLSDQNAAQEDVATLYSWANLHGAKYRDFSAARAQTREKARLRAEQAMEEALRQSRPAAAAAAPQPAGDEIRSTEQTQAVDAPLVAELDRPSEHDRPAGQIQSADALQQEPSGHVPAQPAQVDQNQIEQSQIEQAQIEPDQPQSVQMSQTQNDAAQNDANLIDATLLDATRDDPTQNEATEQAVAERRQADLAAQLAAAQQAAEQAARVEAEQAARRAAQEAAEMAALQTAQRARDHAAYLAEQEEAQRLVQRAAEQAAQQLSQQRTWQQQPPAVRFPPTPAAPYYPPPAQKAEYEFSARTQPFRPPAGPFSTPLPAAPPFAPPRPEQPARETSAAPREAASRDLWTAPEVREPAARPAWLSAEARPAPGPFAPPLVSPGTNPSSAIGLPPAPNESLQGSRDRLASRWFALRGVFEGALPEALPVPVDSWPPTLAVFSLAGGVGKTSLVATLGRALSARGERVLLVDTAAFGLLPFFFGATDQRPGMLRVFTPPIDSSDAPIQMVTIDPDGQSADQSSPDGLIGEISRFTRDAGRILIDLATASGATTRRIMRMAPMVLVPVIADMNSVVSVSSIDSFFEYNAPPAGKYALPYYVLNQFDASLPLHLDVREVLREQLGERLLPFALRRAPAMSEALAEGMTVMDYAPGSTLADDFNTLAGWVRTLAAPAATNHRSSRWSER
jgi:cellulose synthase operon protein YhjQ